MFKSWEIHGIDVSILDDLPYVGFNEAVDSDQHVIRIFLRPAFGQWENWPIDILWVCHDVHVIWSFSSPQSFSLLWLIKLCGWIVLILRKMLLPCVNQHLQWLCYLSCEYLQIQIFLTLGLSYVLLTVLWFYQLRIKVSYHLALQEQITSFTWW